MERYTVIANYYDCYGLKDHSYWVVDETTPFYEAKDTVGKVHILVPLIKQDAADAGITEVCIHVYELGKEVTDKFLKDMR